jgi:hypothetical protein
VRRGKESKGGNGLGNGSQPERVVGQVQETGCESGQVTARLRLAFTFGISRTARASSVQI